MEVIGQLHASVALTPGLRASGTHSIGGWMGPRACLDAVIEPRSSNPLPSHYTN